MSVVIIVSDCDRRERVWEEALFVLPNVAYFALVLLGNAWIVHDLK